MPELNKAFVTGAGAMGSQIGMVCALGGFTVDLHDVKTASLATPGERSWAQPDRVRDCPGRP